MPSLECQRGAGIKRDAQDLSDHDRMIAAGVDGVGCAFEPRQTILEQRDIMRAMDQVDRREIRAVHGEMAGNPGLVFFQDMNGEVGCRDEGVVAF